MCSSDLYFFPTDIKYEIRLIKNIYKDTFNFIITNNTLIITRLDKTTGWGYNHSVDICIQSKECIYLFKEHRSSSCNMESCYVTYKCKKILDSCDREYYKNKEWL